MLENQAVNIRKHWGFVEQLNGKANRAMIGSGLASRLILRYLAASAEPPKRVVRRTCAPV
jgi:hypothetical protein